MKEAANRGGPCGSYCLILVLVALAAPVVDTLFDPDDHSVPPPVHTPPEQLPLPFIRLAEAAVVRTIEPNNAIDKAIAKNSHSYVLQYRSYVLQYRSMGARARAYNGSNS